MFVTFHHILLFNIGIFFAKIRRFQKAKNDIFILDNIVIYFFFNFIFINLFIRSYHICIIVRYAQTRYAYMYF